VRTLVPRRTAGLALAAVLVAVSSSGCAGSSRPTEQVMPAVLHPPGTLLRDGLSVLTGSQLLGTVFESEPATWRAVLQVDGNPLAIYRSYLTALGFSADVSSNPACQRKTDDADRTGCEAMFNRTSATGEILGTTVQLTTVPGDVTGHYLLLLKVGQEPWQDPTNENPPEGAKLTATDPVKPGHRPKPGETFPGESLDDADPPYVLLKGTELVAKVGIGSNTGGFEVLLHVTPGAAVADLARQYTRQATQGASEQPVIRARAVAGTTYSEIVPPGEAGGFSSIIRVADQPGGDQDYLWYWQGND
jgi:hypothetical protein